MINHYNAVLFITLCLGSTGMDHFINVSCYKEIILQRNYRELSMIKKTPLSQQN